MKKTATLDASIFKNYWATVFRNRDLLGFFSLKFMKVKIFVDISLSHEIKEIEYYVFSHLTKVEYKKLEKSRFQHKILFWEKQPIFQKKSPWENFQPDLKTLIFLYKKTSLIFRNKKKKKKQDEW